MIFFKFVSDELKNNFDIVKIAVNACGDALPFASDKLKNNFDIVKIAVNACIDASQFAITAMN